MSKTPLTSWIKKNTKFEPNLNKQIVHMYFKNYDTAVSDWAHYISNLAELNCISPENGESPLFSAVSHAPKLVKYLIEAGANVYHKSNENKTFVFGLMLKEPEVFNEIVDSLAKTNQLDVFLKNNDKGKTVLLNEISSPLHHIGYKNWTLNTAKLICVCPEILKKVDKDGNNLLHVAFLNNRINKHALENLIDFFNQNGVTKELAGQKNRKGKLPMDYFKKIQNFSSFNQTVFLKFEAMTEKEILKNKEVKVAKKMRTL